MKKTIAFAALLFSSLPVFALEMSSWLSYQIQRQETLDLYGRNFTSVGIFAYDFDTNDSLRPAKPWVNSTLDGLMAIPHAGRPVFITIVNDIESDPPQQHNGQLVLRVLSDPARRAAHIRQIVALSAHADGIDIDYEGLLTGTRPYFTQFIQELRAALPQGKLLSIVCQPKTNNDDGPRGQAFDWVALHPYVDIMKIMTYYYSFGASPPGPSAPLDKVHDVTQLAIGQIPAQKLHIVLTQFGFDWPQNGPGQFLSFEEATQIAQLHNATPFRDLASQVLRVNYTEGSVPHQIWYEDDVSLRAKIAIIQSLGVQKVDIWQLGVGDTNFWDWAAANTTNPLGSQNPVPTLTSLAPVSVPAGSPDFQIILTGSNFVSTSIVRWNGQSRLTTFLSPTRLMVNISAADVAAAGQATLTVFNPPPSGGVSAGQIFTITATNPVPTISALSPISVFVGGPTFTLSVTGTNFISGTVLQWNGADRPTTVLSGTTLTAQIPASDISTVGTAAITIFNPAPGGGTSTPQNISILTPLSPAISSLTPESITAGSPNFRLVVKGENFRDDSVLHWNGDPRPTFLTSTTELSATITAGDIVSAGTNTVTIVDSIGTSNPFFFSVKEPLPQGSAPLSDLNQIRAFPNPWKSSDHKNVPITFDLLPVDSTVKLYTLSSRWIKSLKAPLGIATWDLTNDAGEPVASGYYYYFVKDPNGHESKGKVAIIR